MCAEVVDRQGTFIFRKNFETQYCNFNYIVHS